MASWEVSVFDETTEELIEEFKVQGLNREAVRAIWGLASDVAPAGEFPVTERELGQLNQLLDRPLRIEPGRALFIGLRRDYPGEAIIEDDGECWYPPPGIEAPLPSEWGAEPTLPKSSEE